MFPICKAMRLARMPAAIVVLFAAGAVTVETQRGHGGGHAGGMMNDPAHQADMRLLRELFDHRLEITRQVTDRADGVETLTESGNPAVAESLRTHVESMLARVSEARPIHQRDPLFREIFRNADQIDATYQRTEKGVRVVETSRDAYVVRLIQAHARVVTAFIANGRAEMMKNHPIP